MLAFQLCIHLYLRFNGTVFRRESDSLYDHKSVDHLGSFETKPFTVGGVYPNENPKTEQFNSTSNQWTEVTDYPFATY